MCNLHCTRPQGIYTNLWLKINLGYDISDSRRLCKCQPAQRTWLSLFTGRLRYNCLSGAYAARHHTRGDALACVAVHVRNWRRSSLVYRCIYAFIVEEGECALITASVPCAWVFLGKQTWFSSSSSANPAYWLASLRLRYRSFDFRENVFYVCGARFVCVRMCVRECASCY